MNTKTAQFIQQALNALEYEHSEAAGNAREQLRAALAELQPQPLPPITVSTEEVDCAARRLVACHALHATGGAAYERVTASAMLFDITL